MEKHEVDAALAKPTTSVEVAGRVLGISRAAAYRAAGSGDLPAFRIGRKIVVPTAKLRQLIGLEVPPKEAA